MTHNILTFNFPTPIHYGPGARQQIAGLFKAQNVTKPLLVTDRGLIETPIIDDLKALLASAGLQCTVFSEIWGNPVKSQVLEGLESYRQAQADAILMVGGGAAMDVAKSIALLVNNPGDLFDYEDGKPDGMSADSTFPYMIAVPTTAGTGSEVGRSAVISDDITHAKKIIFSPKMLPNQVISDAELTIYLPPAITAATGIDALTHLLEAYLAKDFHPMCDGIALEGLKLVATELENCVNFAKHPEMDEVQIAARSKMLLAAHMGATAFQKGLGVNHSLAHALSTVCDLHHGLANGIMLPYAMAFNSQAVPARFKVMATTIGTNDFIGWIEDLKQRIDIPRKLSDVGVEASQIEPLAEIAFADTCHLNNPRPVSQEELMMLYRQAL